MLENETAEGWGFRGWGGRFWRRLLSSCARYYKLKISLGGCLQVFGHYDRIIHDTGDK